jgi:perosamine synthetase
MDFRIDWSGRAFDYSETEIAAVVDVMRQGDPLTQGRHLRQFESDFAAYLGVEHAFAVANATNALDLIALLADIKPGDEIVVPAHTFCASVIPFLRRGAKLRWADIEPSTLVVSAETIARAITDETKFVMVVHLYGLMPDMDPIVELCQARGIRLIEDAAQALGAEDRSRRAGSIGDFAAFSFQGQKNLTTLGEGGMLIAKDPALAELAPGLRHNGLRPFQRAQGDDSYWLPAMSDVASDIPGELPFNFCLSEAQCAVGSAVLARIDDMNAARRARAAAFQAALADYPELRFQHVGEGKVSSHHLLVASYTGSDGADRDAFISRMAFTHGVKCVVQYRPLYRYDLIKVAGFGEGNCPESDRFYDSMISFPFHLWMSDADFHYMCESVVETAQALRAGVQA